ncbi:MAG: hypothetical protein ABIT71_21625 [Vicinamibacteraceae bacterium]
MTTPDECPKWKVDLPAFPHKMIDTPLALVCDFYLEHLERDAKAGRLAPTAFWVICRGLMLGARQGYASVCLLLAEKRPKPLLLQAGILNRSLFETLINIAALVAEPARIRILEREGFRTLALRYEDHSGKHPSDSKWKDYLAVYRANLDGLAARVDVTAAEVANPSAIALEWPTPGRLLFGQPSKKVAPWVDGNVADVLKKLYAQYYPHQSELAHQRIAAVSAALVVENPDEQWNPGHAESDLVSTAALLLACIVAELQSAGNYAKHPKLAELWGYLCELDEEFKDVWGIRYSSLV